MNCLKIIIHEIYAPIGGVNDLVFILIMRGLQSQKCMAHRRA